MGIPFYFGEVIAKSPASRRFQTITSSLPYKCSRMFLDFNSIIHMCSAHVVSQASQTLSIENLKKRIFDYITEYTLDIIQYANPSDLVYIAIDGVAPRAKMSQQRKRRYMSAQRNIAIEAFKKQHGIPFVQWDSNCITPGTVFMHELAEFLENDFRHQAFQRFPHLQQLYVSNATEQGEGEHKMIHYIKEKPLASFDVCDVVYGLDADLIMLSLTCSESKIVLMRESNNFIGDKGGNKTPFKYLVIDRLRESIIDTFGIAPHDPSCKEQLVFDYVFMCFFLGNDFIPSLSFLKIQESAVDVLMSVYRKICTQEGLLKCDEPKQIRHTINIDVLERFLNELKNIEDEMMIQAHEQFYNAVVHPPRNFNNVIGIIKQQSPHITLKDAQSKAVKEFLNDLDKFPLRNKPKHTFSPRDDPKWRNSYYHFIFGANTPDLITDSCNNYIDGLMWTTNYYFNKSANNDWYYKYSYAPCASDLFKHVVSSPQDSFTVKQKILFSNIGPAVTPQLQLLMVLPPQSVDLLPPELQSYMTDMTKGCLHYYPKDFKTQTYLKNKGWECIPVLPLVDVSRLRSMLGMLGMLGI